MIRKALLLLSVGLLVACAPKETLLRDLSEREANEIVATLYANNITTHKEADAKGKSFAVTVPKGDLAKAVAVLHANGLPREHRPSLNEIFKPNGFAPTPFEERVRFIYGISQELERTIAYMQGVLNVRVHIVIPEKVSRREVVQPTSASVFINYDDQVPFGVQVPNVRKLVSESVEGLKEENVEVVAVGVKVNLQRSAPATPATDAQTPTDLDKTTVISIVAAVLLLIAGAIAYTQRAAIAKLLGKRRV